MPPQASLLLRIFLVSLAVGMVMAQESGTRKPRPRRPPPKTTEKPAAEEEEEVTDECPMSYGYFPDADQCDKYHFCHDGKVEDKLCPDGMVFNDFSPEQEKCDLPFNIDCSHRPNLQEPIPSMHCPRQNGYFGHSDSKICDKFYYCVDGMFNMITCPQGLVFNPKTGICTWPDEAHKIGCSSADVFQFTCPKVNETEAVAHPRYADPDDCQFFYVCINGEVPRRNGCKLGQAFDETRKTCDWARKIPECADWYKDRLSDEELDALENPKPKNPTATKGPGRRKVKKQKVVVPVSEEEEEEE